MYKKGDVVVIDYPDCTIDMELTSDAIPTFTENIYIGFTYNTAEGGWCAESWIKEKVRGTL